MAQDPKRQVLCGLRDPGSHLQLMFPARHNDSHIALCIQSQSIMYGSRSDQSPCHVLWA